MLSREQTDFYRENGYLLVEDAVPPALIEEARAAVAELVAASRFVKTSDERYDLEDTHTAANPRVRRIKEPHTAHPVFERLLRGDLLVDAVADLLGPNIRFQHTKLNIKPGHGGEAVEWHQDWAFYPHTNDDILEVGVMLDDCTPENGPLLVIPGSHRGPIHNHHFDGCFAGAIDLTASEIGADRAVPLLGKAGSITLHHVRMVHGSEANNSDRDRRLLLYGYAAADAWMLPAHLYPGLEAYEAQMVRGRSTLEPRLEAVPVRMPYPLAPNQGSIFENQRLVRGRSFGAAGGMR
ncbi:MAG: phytanoyl-CoA dioxygenase family protein [Alphaproteobacteria bacterium]